LSEQSSVKGLATKNSLKEFFYDLSGVFRAFKSLPDPSTENELEGISFLDHTSLVKSLSLACRKFNKQNWTNKKAFVDLLKAANVYDEKLDAEIEKTNDTKNKPDKTQNPSNNGGGNNQPMSLRTKILISVVGFLLIAIIIGITIFIVRKKKDLI
jgi:hypothetical protein